MARAPSRQILSVEEAFGKHGWHVEMIEGRDVLAANFEAHHTRVQVFAQAYPQLNALNITSETSFPISSSHLATMLKLLMHANKQLTLGNLEYDLDRQFIVFRQSNLFVKEVYDADIISSMVHCAIAELDRIIPYLGVVRDTREDLLADLHLPRLLMREDILPPVLDDQEEEEY